VLAYSLRDSGLFVRCIKVLIIADRGLKRALPRLADGR